jgi:hypothetical protein
MLPFVNKICHPDGSRLQAMACCSVASETQKTAGHSSQQQKRNTEGIKLLEMEAKVSSHNSSARICIQFQCDRWSPLLFIPHLMPFRFLDVAFSS